jgi:hypothetical protein
MWLRTSLLIPLYIACSSASAATLNFPGDTLAKGQQFVSSSTGMGDWHYAGEYIGVATIAEKENSQRGIVDSKNNGYSFSTVINYLYGLSDDLSVGLSYGYRFDKEESTISGTQAPGLQGELKSEGGTDVSLLGAYRLLDGVAANVALVLPMCSASAVDAVCNTEPAKPTNTVSKGESGGQGDGYYQLNGELAANWLSEDDERWFARLFSSITLSDSVFGNKASSPFMYGFGIGHAYSVGEGHNLISQFKLTRGLEYSAYSEQVQADVSYSDQSSLGFKTEYVWSWLPSVQVRPFFEVAIVQQPDMTFVSNAVDRSLEFTGGTYVTLGAQLRASF